MKSSGVLIFTLSSILLASCPLGFPPDEACPSESPSCALFIDENGDGLCDNPGPQPSADYDPLEEGPPSDSSETVPDSLDIEPISVTDSLPENTVDDTVSQVEANEIESPTAEPAEAYISGREYLSEGNQVTILSDAEGDLFCIYPGHERDAELSYIVWEIAKNFTDSSTVTEEIQIEISRDSVSVDTVIIEKLSTSALSCPLGYLPEEACLSENPSCVLFTDANSDSYCDNPGMVSDSTPAVNVHVSGMTYGLIPLASGCPLGLPPEAACPSSDNSLCPHYMGLQGCVNPSGGGIKRTLIVLFATAVLLPTATILKRLLRGRRKEDRRKRKIAHITVQVLSILVLGFLVQGCFCPLGVIQYAMLPGGLVFLGGLGIAVLILPMLWSVFFGRIYCGWVCPFGALQDLLGKLHVPRPPNFSSKVHSVLSGLRYLLALLFFGLIILASSGQFESLKSAAFFCRYDPFHTIFSFFMIGSFAGAIAAMSILVFFPRIFCKYICFYGAILSFLSRIELWKRLTRKHPSPTQNDESKKPAAP